MIELPNPAAGAEDAPAVVYVYRHWTHAEMMKVVEGVPPPSKGAERCVREFRLLVQ